MAAAVQQAPDGHQQSPLRLALTLEIHGLLTQGIDANLSFRRAFRLDDLTLFDQTK